ncbi:MAG TPA: nitrilase-related carbon-nitrogen hydrolase [Hanamia sp.]|nr:nitrilase-related carbon-nitrogen hydrolase [Hanamia sp.]
MLNGMHFLSTKRVLFIFSILISGACWFFSNGLHGDYWYVLWIAPVPVFLCSFYATAKETFFIAFISYLLGRLSWFSYLSTVATLVPAIIATIVLPLIFALVIVLFRSVVIKINSWYSVFAFPVFFTTYEWLLLTFSYDGSAASIAYSQANFLPIIQLASITGILGITFLVTFIPSAIAFAWRFRNKTKQLLFLSLTSLSILALVFIYGFVRLSNSTSDTTTAGLVALDEKTHKVDGKLNDTDELQHTKDYTKEINNLAAQGSKVVVLPERAINITREIDSATMEMLSNAARTNHVFIVTGYTNLINKKDRNSALVIDDNGNVLSNYNKRHLVKGFEDRFTPGKKIGLFTFDNDPAGVAICKDLDYPGYINQYGKSKIDVLCVPAWDFVVDDWLHSRMAILRGVENGFSEIRTARQGRLTISDPYGRVLAEASSSDGKAARLIGKVPLVKLNTFYSQHGDWIGYVMILATVFFLFTIITTKPDKNENVDTAMA